MSKATNSEQNWQTLLTLFPRNWREVAEETGANRRLRGMPSLEALMRTLLLHLARGYSLHETVVRAKAAGVAELSAVALFKRLRNAEEWLNELCRALLPLSELTVPTVPKAVRLRLVDSTTVKEPGKTGSLWRLQYSFQLPEFRCDYFRLHPGEGEGTGDSFVQFPITRDDHVIGDRGYCSIAGVEHIAAHGGSVLVRLNPMSLPLFTPTGRRVPVLRRLATLHTAGQVGEWPVVVHGDKRLIPGRLSAVRKSAEAITLAEKRLKRTASRKGRDIRPETWEYAKYVMVFSTFSPHRFTMTDLLQWYRIRWQVGVSREGSLTQSVQVRPRLRDSGLVAREAPGRESKPVKPSDTPLGRERAQRSRLQRAVNAAVASLHATPVAEPVYYVRRQQGPGETSPQRRSSPAGSQR
jgi:hypothetical protein